MKIKVILKKGVDGYIVAAVPALPGCFSQGKTKQEAMRNIREAIELYLEPDPKELKPSKNEQILTLAL